MKIYKLSFPLPTNSTAQIRPTFERRINCRYFHYRYIGKEASGSEGEALDLKNKKPHNPLLLTGGLTLASLMKPSLCFSERFEYFLKKCVQ